MSDSKLYTVQPGHSVRAGGKSYRHGTAHDTVALGMADAQRLLDMGVILPADPAAGDGKGEGSIDTWADDTLAGTVAEVTERLAGLGADALAVLAEVEAGGKARKGVLEAIEAAKAPKGDQE